MFLQFDFKLSLINSIDKREYLNTIESEPLV